MQLRRQQANSRNQKSTSPSHSCGEQSPLKTKLLCDNKQRVECIPEKGSSRNKGHPGIRARLSRGGGGGGGGGFRLKPLMKVSFV